MKKSFSPLYPYLAWDGEGSKSIDKAAERYLKEVESPERRKNLK